MTQMGFAQTEIARAPQSHRAHSLRMSPFNACPMTIDVLELIGLLPLACCKKCLHLLLGVQGQAAPSRARAGGSAGADLTIALGKLHLDECFAGILDRRPTRTDPTLRTGDRLGFPIN